MTKIKFSNLRLLAFLVVFAAIGAIILITTHAASTLPGDITGDGHVDSTDLGFMIANYNTVYPAADFNNSGKVDGSDFATLLKNYGASVSGGGGGKLNSVAKILYDMQPPNEDDGHGTLSGVLKSPHLSYNAPPPGTGFVEAWGGIYPDTSNSYPANVRVAVKDMETYVWSISQAKWVRLQAVLSPGGALYSYNFTSHIAGNKRTEPDGSVSISLQDGYLFHFFPTAHAAITESDIGGVFTTFQARLILDSPTGSDNIDQTKWIADSGADFYPTPAGSNYSFNNHFNVGVGGGKFVYLSRSWEAFSFYAGGPPSVMSTGKYPSSAWSEARLQANPPPLDGMGPP